VKTANTHTRFTISNMKSFIIFFCTCQQQIAEILKFLAIFSDQISTGAIRRVLGTPEFA